MRVAILSDIHANLRALVNVLDDALHLGAEALWCLGDVTGYGPWPAETWDTLQEVGLPLYLLAGNHDWGLANHERVRILGFKNSAGQTVNLGYYNQNATEVHRRQRSDLQTQREERLAHGKADILEALLKLPVVCSPSEGIYLAHGCLDAQDAFIVITWYPDEIASAEHSFQAAWKLARGPASDSKPGWITSTPSWQPPRLICVGHNHRRAVWQRRNNDPEAKPGWDVLPSEGTVPLGDWEEHPVMLNPGSVGFPRDGKGPASYILLDLEKKEATFRSVAYDVDTTRKKLDELGYPSFVKGFLDSWKPN